MRLARLFGCLLKGAVSKEMVAQSQRQHGTVGYQRRLRQALTKCNFGSSDVGNWCGRRCAEDATMTVIMMVDGGWWMVVEIEQIKSPF